MADMMVVVGPPPPIEIYWLEGAPQVASSDLNWLSFLPLIPLVLEPEFTGHRSLSSSP